MLIGYYVNVEGCDLDVECTSWIREHYVFLLDNLDLVFSGLLDHLFQDQVIEMAELDDVRTERTSFKQNERLLSILGRKSRDKIQLFFKNLDVTGQSHIRKDIIRRQGYTFYYVIFDIKCKIKVQGLNVYRYIGP